MTYRVVIRAFTLRRDVGAAFMIKRFLEERGCSVIIASVRDYERVVKHWAPHAVITNTKSSVLPAKKLSPGVLVFYWPGEGGAEDFMYSSAKRMTAEIYAALDCLLVWGRKPKEFFDQVHPTETEKVVICGSARLDTVKYCQDIIRPAAKTGSVGFVGKYPFINSHQGIPAAIKLTKTQRHYEMFLNQAVGFYHVVKAIDCVVNETDFRVSVRPYPSEDLGTWAEIVERKGWGDRVDIDATFMFGDWAARQEVIVSLTSTSFVESYVLGIPTISLDNLIHKESKGLALHWKEHLSRDLSLVPETFEDLARLLRDSDLPAPAKNPAIEEHMEEFHDWSSPHAATERIAAVVVDKLKQTKFGARPHMPAAMLQLWDYVSFTRAMRKSPMHANFNFYAGRHKEPPHFETIMERLHTLPRPGADAGADAQPKPLAAE